MSADDSWWFWSYFLFFVFFFIALLFLPTFFYARRSNYCGEVLPAERCEFRPSRCNPIIEEIEV